jgi:hypothetical protein
MSANPSNPYSSDDLRMLARVFEEALQAIIDHAPLNETQIRELSSQLGKVLMNRFTAGENDPERLKKIAIESVRGSR